MSIIEYQEKRSTATLPASASERTMQDWSPWLIARPALDYQHAFDMCGQYAAAAGGPVAIIADSERDIAELLKRCDGRSVQVIPLAADGRPDLDALDRPAGGAGAAALHTLVWVTPAARHLGATIEQVGRRLADDGRLLVLCHGLAARLVQRGARAADRHSMADARNIQRSMEHAGLRIELYRGLHGPSSLVWGALGLLLAKLGRDDLADRCHFRMRASYVVEGWQSSLAPLLLVVARRSDGSGA